MPTFTAVIHISIKKDVLNPEEPVVIRQLHGLGFASVSHISMGKCHIVTFGAENKAQAEDRANEMCKKLLVSPVTEIFKVQSITES